MWSLNPRVGTSPARSTTVGEFMAVWIEGCHRNAV